MPIDPAARSTAEGGGVDGGERGEGVEHCSSGRVEEQDMGKTVVTIVAVLMVLSGLLGGEPAEGPDYWVEPMRKVHARFDDKKGTFACFGDSITVTMAFWAPMQNKRLHAPREMKEAFQLVNNYMARECWRSWKGPAFGNQGRMTIRWARQNIDKWLDTLNPEVALIMFGTNDLRGMTAQQHEAGLREVVRKCLDHGTVVILSTIPPRHGLEMKAKQFVEAQRKVARDLKVPLIDYYGEIMKRRPEDWDGKLDKFKDYKGYDVPALIARDGVHPSHPKKYRDDYSREALHSNGYSLRNYLTLMKYAEVIGKVLQAPTTEPEPDTHEPKESTKPALINPPTQPWFPKAPPLPPPEGEVIKVSNVNELFKAAKSVKPGGTILVADGHYMLPRYLVIRTGNVTLRGESGIRENVVLDGAESSHGELVGITGCSGVTIADLTIQNVQWNGFKINANTGVHKVTITNCIIHNVWQRGIKGVPGELQEGKHIPVRDCRIQYCLFYNDRAKRLEDDPYERQHPDKFGGNYIGGIDAMNVTNWVISDNVFIGIRGRTGSARGAIFIWNGSEDVVIERNIIIDCDSGICLGNSHRRPEVWPIHCTRFVVRNNFVTCCPEVDILTDYTRDCKVINNTVHDPKSRFGRLIRIVHDNDGLLVTNNIFSGQRIVAEKYTGTIELKNNLVKPVPEYFVDATGGNLHLTAAATEAINKAIAMDEVQEDIDRQARGDQPDLGADEFEGSS